MKKLLNTASIDYTVYVDVLVVKFEGLEDLLTIHTKTPENRRYVDGELIPYYDSRDTILYDIPEELEILPESCESNSSYSYCYTYRLKDNSEAGKLKIIFRLPRYLINDEVHEDEDSASSTVVRKIQLVADSMFDDTKARHLINKYCREFMEYVSKIK